MSVVHHFQSGFITSVSSFAEYLTLLTLASHSAGFQRQDYQHLVFPSEMYIDYIRVYQRVGVKNGLTCDPPSHPTTDYITR
jgi:Beta-glucan synthesis-associated protein SKN1/KRE6/Sbg1